MNNELSGAPGFIIEQANDSDSHEKLQNTTPDHEVVGGEITKSQEDVSHSEFLDSPGNGHDNQTSPSSHSPANVTTMAKDIGQTHRRNSNENPDRSRSISDSHTPPSAPHIDSPISNSNHSVSQERTLNEEKATGGEGSGVSCSSNDDNPPPQDATTGEVKKQREVSAPAALPNTTIVWAASLIILTCYVIVVMTIPTLSTQYLNYKIGRDDYNFSYSSGDKDTDCDNSSSAQKDLLNDIQRDTSSVVLISSLASGIPSTLTCLVVGSYSDFLGRRPLIVASIVGCTIKAASLAAVIYYDLSVVYFYLGSFVDGALGSYFTLALAVTAVIADITPVPQARALRFAVVEGTLFTAGALAQLVIGFMIKSWDYFAPAAINTCLLVVALVVSLLCLPETMTTDNKVHFRWNPTLHMRKVFGFYFIRAPGRSRLLYNMAIAFFFFLVVTNLARPNVETLFVLNSPICWDSIDIGIFQAVRLTICSVVAVLVLRLLRNRLSLEVIGIISGLSAAAGFAMEGLANTGAEMYLAGLVGILYTTAIPIPRAIMSQMTSPSEQGALFSSLACVESAGSMVANLIYTLIYNATLNTFKGAVFLVMAALCSVSVILFGTFRCERGNRPLSCLDYEIESDTLVVPPSLTTSPSSNDIVTYRDSTEGYGEKHRSRRFSADESSPLLAT